MARLSLSRALVPTPRSILAAVTLACVVAMTPSCFITSTPDFKPPPQTPPFLLGQTASPPLGDIIVVEPNKPVPLSAGLLSEDAKQDVIVDLYVDYGVEFANNPYYFEQEIGTVKASTMSDTSRNVSLAWNPPFPLSGCHTLTLIVSHAFAFDALGGERCPVNRADSSLLTWDAYFCSDTATCPPMIDPSVACKPPTQMYVDCPVHFPPTDTTTSSSTGSAG